MLYGRVIGNELRDVPPECLPIWGQRWSSYRAPHGPSAFSTRVLSVDRMSEVGPVLTSPSQFEATFAEEDDWEDAHSESSQNYATFSSSLLTDQMVVTQPTPRSETPTPLPDHRSSNHAGGNPKVLYWSSEHPSSQDPITSAAALLPGWEFEQPGTRDRTLDSLSRSSDPRHSIPGQAGRGSLQNDYILWDMERASTTQPSGGPSQEQLQHTIDPYSIPEWWSANAYTRDVMYPFHPDHLPYPGRSYLPELFQADDQPCFIPATSPFPSHFFTRAPQQNTRTSSYWNDGSSMIVTPGIVHPNNPMMVQWQTEVVPPDLSFPVPLQNVGSSLDQGTFYHLVSDPLRSSSHPEDSPGAFTRPESRTVLSLDKPRDDQCG